VFDAAHDLPYSILVDEKRLRQVLLNLLGNAVKFTDQGTVRLGVRRLEADAEHARLRFEVLDTGVGIHPKDAEGIFEPFEQVGDSHRRAGGTGLGLAISRQLVRLMGSDIHLESRPAPAACSGSKLVLPVAGAAGVVALPAQKAISGYVGPRRLILIADDVPGNRSMLTDLLRPLDFDTREASDGVAGARCHERAPRRPWC